MEDPFVEDIYPLKTKNPPTIVPKKISKAILPVEVQEARLAYRDRRQHIQALRDVSLQVAEGNIFTLLGPSGCGKTTLLRCLVGLETLQSGQVHLFGLSPGSTASSILGPTVGYMPQELSLYPHLTVEETLYFFGRLQFMSKSWIEKRTSFLFRLLDLQRWHTSLVSQLSGGQQRRLSLAVSLIRDPALLILDEPTVGADPLLRTKLWNHFQHLAHTLGKTVLITTHYIEEARKADMVAFMREGKILTSGMPEEVIQRYNCRTLEEVFLRVIATDDDVFSGVTASTTVDEYLCSELVHTENAEVERNCSYSSTPDDGLVTPICSKTRNQEDVERTICDTDTSLTQSQRGSEVGDCHLKSNSLEAQSDNAQKPCSRIRLTNLRFLVTVWIVTWKNTRLLRRNYMLLVILMLSPLFNVILIKVMLGRPPFHLPLAVVNEEKPANLSFDFLEQLDGHTFTKLFRNETQEAISLVRLGRAWAALCIGKNFTNNIIKERLLDGNLEDIEANEDRNIVLYIDSTNIEIFRTLHNTILNSYDAFVEATLKGLNMNPSLMKIPLVIEEPIFGQKQPHFADFTNANMLSDSLFIMSLGLAALTLILEKVYGLFDRCRVCGLTICHILISHLVLNSLIAVLQICLLLVYLAFTFSVTLSPSSFCLIAWFCFLASSTGMSIGILVSAVARRPFPALLLVTAIYQVNGLASGMLWPYESQPKWIRYFTSLSPQVFTIQAIREVLFKGWGLDHKIVWSAFQVGLAWTSGPLLLTALLYQRFSCLSNLFNKIKRSKNVGVELAERKELLT